MYQLYGDGIHDDYPAIQEMIDSGVRQVTLPAPQNYYLISQTLLIPSNFKLVLPRFAEIRLAAGANCYMVRNRYVKEEAQRVNFYDEEKRKFWNYACEASPAPEHACENFELEGGIWNFNNREQAPNPIQTHVFPESGYPGFGMLFYNVKNFRLSSMTLKDPVNYAMTICTASYFTVEDITFDFQHVNPLAINMDGIHMDGNCHFGCIRNLKGACYDDLVALNAGEGLAGPITNMEIQGIYAQKCHSAVRMLTLDQELSRIHISNIYGTYYQYCVAFSKFYEGEYENGFFDQISVDHVYASKADRTGIYPWPQTYIFPLFWFEKDIRVRNVVLQDIHRREYEVPVETLYVGENTVIDHMMIRDVSVENHTGKAVPFMVNRGHIKKLCLEEIRAGGDVELQNEGKIEERKE